MRNRLRPRRRRSPRWRHRPRRRHLRSPRRPSPPPPPGPNQLRVYGAFAYRPDDGGGIVTQAGFSIGGSFERRYLKLASGVELGVAVDGAFTRFSTSGSPVIVPGQAMTYAAARTLSQTGFAVLQTAGWRLGRVRPFVGGGRPASAWDISPRPRSSCGRGTASTTQAMARDDGRRRHRVFADDGADRPRRLHATCSPARRSTRRRRAASRCSAACWTWAPGWRPGSDHGARARITLLLLVVPALALGGLCLAVVATAAARAAGAPGLGAPGHFAVRQLVGLGLGARALASSRRLPAPSASCASRRSCSSSR